LPPRRLAYLEKPHPSCRSAEAIAQVVPVLVCHDEVVGERDEDRDEETRRWLEKATMEVIDTVVSYVGEEQVPVEVKARIVRSWGESN